MSECAVPSESAVFPTMVARKLMLDSSTSTSYLWHLAFYVLSKRLVLLARGIRFSKELILR